MKKYYLLVKGNVTDVGFRVFAKKIANKLGINGYIENLGNDVRIFCGVDEEEILEKFITELQSHNTEHPEEDIYGVYVEDIKLYKEGDKEYKKLKPKIEKLDRFYLDHELDENIRKFEKEMLTRMEAGTGILQFKFNYMDKKYDMMSKSLTSLLGFFKIYSIFTGGIFVVMVILAILVYLQVT